jgi:hypothetical protein
VGRVAPQEREQQNLKHNAARRQLR